jgi:hypothetical protein
MTPTRRFIRDGLERMLYSRFDDPRLKSSVRLNPWLGMDDNVLAYSEASCARNYTAQVVWCDCLLISSGGTGITALFRFIENH